MSTTLGLCPFSVDIHVHVVDFKGTAVHRIAQYSIMTIAFVFMYHNAYRIDVQVRAVFYDCRARAGSC